ncbi:MAG: hypothetical protein ACLSFT_08195 [Ruminococcus callidus]
MTLVRDMTNSRRCCCCCSDWFAVAGCGAFVGLNYNDRYYLCLLMGMFGLLLALWTGFAAVSVKNRGNALPCWQSAALAW